MNESTDKRKDRRMSIITVRILLAALVIALYTATFAHSIAWGENEQRKSEQSDTSVFSSLETQTLDGQKFSHEEFGNSRLTMINVWETTCPACLREMPALQNISNQYDPSEFRIIGVCADLLDSDGSVNPERLEKSINLMNDAGVTFYNLVPTPELLTFITATVAGFPTSFFIDSDGNVVDVSVGANTEENWKAYIDNLISKQK